MTSAVTRKDETAHSHAPVLMLPPKLRIVFGIGALAIPVLILAVSVLLATHVSRGKISEQQLEQLEAESNQLQQLVSLLKDAEIGQRGYLLTGRADYLKPYGAAVPAVEAEITRLAHVWDKSPAARAQFAALAALVNRRLAEMAGSVALARNGHLEIARAGMASGEGEIALDGISAAVARMVRAEALARAPLLRDRHDRKQRTNIYVATLVCIVLLFIVFSAWMVDATLRERNRLFHAQERAEKARSDLLERFRLALEAGQIAVWEVDLSTMELMWDDRMWSLYGLDRLAGPPTVGRWVDVLHPDEREAVEAVFYKAVKGEAPYNVRFRIVWPDGEIRHIRALATVVRGAAGEPVRMVGTNWDITEISLLTTQLRAEKMRLTHSVEELAAAKRAAEEANQAKSQFLASMSHELRTPLNAILGFSEIIKDELFGPAGCRQYADYAALVHKSGHHLLAVIDDILDLSKVDAGRFELHEEDFDFVPLLADCITLVEGRAALANVTLSMRNAQSVCMLHADQRLLKQVVLNILSNAINFTPAGGSICARIHGDAQGWRFSVRDTGIGMTAEQIAIALSPYGQVDSKIARSHHGTGLGLPISRSFVQLHGGELSIESAPDKGTTISIQLPWTRVRDRALDRAG